MGKNGKRRLKLKDQKKEREGGKSEEGPFEAFSFKGT
jgi:hypothetical protein